MINTTLSRNILIRRDTQLGLSLIEMMIAMLIGIFLLAGISSSYVNSKTSSVKRNQTSVLEDNGRIALETITDILEKTGYTPINAAPMPQQFVNNVGDVISIACPGGSNNIVNPTIITSTSDGGGSDSDTLGVIYHGDAGHFTDCTGNTLPSDCRLLPPPSINAIPVSARIYSSFSVDDSSSTLKCAGSRSESAEVIAEGVENIQFLYGIDTVDDGQVKVDRYVNASQIAGSWNNVVSVQVAILVRSLEKVKVTAISKDYTLLDTVVTSPTDRYQREVFSTTVRLRNTL